MTNVALGPFRLDPGNDLLLRGTEPVALGKRAILLLRALIERPGALISKEALVEAAWPGQAVEESNLTVQIAALRRVLGTASGGGGWIETMPRRGYRFVGPVVTEAPSGIAGRPRGDAVRDTESTPNPDAERRQITVLSCELIVASGRIDGVGLEDMRAAAADFRRRVSETVERHDGLVVSHLGNAALVLFGYPATHEHDAEQAVRAGLELLAAIRALKTEADVRIRCRVGTATGMVIIGGAGRGGTLTDIEIVGDAPDLATHLRLSAQPDVLAIEPVTRRLIGNLFDCSDLGTIDKSDGDEPLRIWRVVAAKGVASRFEALRATGLTPFIGRDEEIELLRRRWERVKAGDGQVVLLSGEPGIGKSRIALELAERLNSEGIFQFRFFCSPYHQDSALYPFIDHVGRAAEFARHDTSAAKLEKLEIFHARAGLPNEDLPFIADLLSLPTSGRHPLPNFSPQRKKERIFEALIRQIEGAARRQPVVMVFEDAHWIDPTSSELLDLVIERVHRLRVLLIVIFRPEFQPRWTGQPEVTMMVLNRLDRRGRAALIDQIAGGKALPSEVIAQLINRTDGVPLFLEELTKSVLESGLLREEPDRYVLAGALPPFAIPPTLQSSLLARLDRLASVRHVAQVGAVIGREFSYVVLRAVSGLADDELQASVGHLVGSELVFRRGTPPDAVYSFKHALVQDAAYGSLLREPRRTLHRAIGETLESQFPEIAETQPELLARHFTEAGSIEKSAGLWAKAGLRSLARSALIEAVEQLTRALDQIATLPATPQHRREQIRLQVALIGPITHVRGFAAPESRAAAARAQQLIKEAETLGEPPDDPLLLFTVLYSFWIANMLAFNGRALLELGRQFLNLAQTQADTAPLMVGHRVMGVSLLCTGKISEGRAHFERALSLYDAAKHRLLAMQFGQDSRSSLLCYRSWTLWILGYCDAAITDADEAVRTAREVDQAATLMNTLGLSTSTYVYYGDYATALSQSEELIALAEEKNAALWRACGLLHRASVLTLTGGAEEAVRIFDAALPAWRATGTTFSLPLFLPVCAKAHADLGRFEVASQYIEEAVATCRKTNETFREAEIWRIAGEITLAQPQADSAKAEAYLERALAIASEQEAKSWELRAATSMARLWRGQGKGAEARSLLAPLYRWFGEGFQALHLKQAKALLDELDG